MDQSEVAGESSKSLRSSEREKKKRFSRRKRDKLKRVSVSKIMRRWRKHFGRSNWAMRILSTMWFAFSGLFAMILLSFYRLLYLAIWAPKSQEEGFRTLGRSLSDVMDILFVKTNPFWKIHVEVEEPLDNLNGCIVMTNHLSFADIFILPSAEKQVGLNHAVGVGQSGLADVPLLGDILESIGFLKVEFMKDKETGKWISKNKTELMNRAVELLKAGFNINIAPEGVISRTGALLPFKPGFFRVAIEANAPIVLAACWGNDVIWPNNMSAQNSLGGRFVQSGDVFVKFSRPIWPLGKDVETLRQECFEKMLELRNSLPNFDLDEKLASSKFGEEPSNDDLLAEAAEEL